MTHEQERVTTQQPFKLQSSNFFIKFTTAQKCCSSKAKIISSTLLETQPEDEPQEES